MPDAAKLIAGLFIGVLAYLISFQIIPLMPESTDFGNFVYINALLGLIVGWIVMGKRAGRGLTAAINNGLGGALMLVLWGLFIYSCYMMFGRALDNWYSGLFAAIAAVFQFMAEYALMLMTPQIVFMLAIGGVMAGLATEYAWRTWR